MKWLILGVGFVVVMALVAFGTLMMIGGDSAPVGETESTYASAKVKKNAADYRLVPGQIWQDSCFYSRPCH